MIRDLCYLGNSVLRKKCMNIDYIDDRALAIAKDLVDTLRDIGSKGIGLAAPQIGFDVRMFALSLSEKLDDEGEHLIGEPVVYINPKITKFSKKKCSMQEGCLSIPKFYEDVARSSVIDFEALDIKGNKIVKKGVSGWMARVIQHEYDHLDGVLFFDHLSKEKQHHVEPILKTIEMHYSRS